MAYFGKDLHPIEVHDEDVRRIPSKVVSYDPLTRRRFLHEDEGSILAGRTISTTCGLLSRWPTRWHRLSKCTTRGSALTGR